MNRRWLLNRTNPEFLAYLSRSASVSQVLAQILINRGIKTADDIKGFMNPGLGSLSDPFDIRDIDKAVNRIRIAAKENEKVLVHGDYDADGVTATAILVSALNKAGIETAYFIPIRIIHGYGFNIAGVEAARKAGARLIITVDCGITAFEAAAYAKESKIDLIITDHHEPAVKKSNKADEPDSTIEFDIPDALSVINPKLSGGSSLTILSGAGIAFKLAQAMSIDNETGFSQDDLLPLLDLAAVGTIADLVPLKGENRIIVKEALPYIQTGSRSGLRAIRQVAGLENKQIRAGHLSYTIVPRINAAGRMGDAADVVKLLLSDSEAESSTLADWIDSANSERQKVEETVYQEALSMAGSMAGESVIMLWDRKWHPGVLGIVASRLTEAFNLPAFIFSVEDGIAKGSGRSIPALDICRALSECSDLLITYGGHSQAAGAKLLEQNLPDFRDRLGEIIRIKVAEESFVPTLEIDSLVGFHEIDQSLIRELEMLEPFGYGNPEPLLGTKELQMLYPKVLKERHLKMKLKKGAVSLDAVGWDMGHILSNIMNFSSLDAAFTPSINTWNGRQSIQLILKGLRPSV